MIARWAIASLFFTSLIGLWQLAVNAQIWSPLLLPSPTNVFIYLWSAVEDGTLAEAAGVTIQRLLIGYGLGILAGLPLGLLTASFRWCQDTIGVLALGLQTLPSVCWVPLGLLWFGQTEAAMLFVVVMGTLWSLIIATDTGVRDSANLHSCGPIKTLRRDGVPTDEILKVADDESADMIILGQSGKRGFDRFITGRVAKHVEKHAKVPVLVAKQPLMCEEPYTKRDARAAVSVTSAVVVLLFIIGFILERGALLH